MTQARIKITSSFNFTYRGLIGKRLTSISHLRLCEIDRGLYVPRTSLLNWTIKSCWFIAIKISGSMESVLSWNYKKKNCLLGNRIWSFSVNPSSMLSIFSWNSKEKNCLLVNGMWNFCVNPSSMVSILSWNYKEKNCLLVNRMWSFSVNPSYMESVLS